MGKKVNHLILSLILSSRFSSYYKSREISKKNKILTRNNNCNPNINKRVFNRLHSHLLCRWSDKTQLLRLCCKRRLFSRSSPSTTTHQLPIHFKREITLLVRNLLTDQFKEIQLKDKNIMLINNHKNNHLKDTHKNNQLKGNHRKQSINHQLTTR